MIKNNRKKFIISSIVTIIPMLFGLIFWNKLPETMNTHWNAQGVADGSSSRAFAVFVIPLIFLAMHVICIIATNLDKSNKSQSFKVTGLIFWICPFISLFSCTMMYMSAFGREFKIAAFAFAILGVMFIFVGNYLPKCKHNYTIGIKVKWALASEENWNATHRFGGKVWVACGLLMMLCMLLPLTVAFWVMFAVIMSAVLVPTVYSFLYYKKQVSEGKAPEKISLMNGRYTKISLVIVLAVVGILLAVLLTGDIEVKYEDTCFTVEASFWSDISVNYSDIDSVEYRDKMGAGLRTFGYGSLRLSMGTFQNDELGSYTRYSYTGEQSCVLITVDESVIVLGGKDTEATKDIYNELLAKTEKALD